MTHVLTTLKLLAVGIMAAGLLAPVTSAPAEAGYGKSKRYASSHRKYRNYDRRSNSEREYDRARAESVDPGGSYRGYPDWARYALSPKSDR